MTFLKNILPIIFALLCMGCQQPEEIADFRLAFLWGNESASNIISADDLMHMDLDMRRDLMREQNKLRIDPITERLGAVVMEYYAVPPARRKTHNENQSAGTKRIGQTLSSGLTPSLWWQELKFATQ